MTQTQHIIEDVRDCKKCKGTGVYESFWHYNPAEPKKSYHGPGPCDVCNSTGKITKPDFKALFAVVTKTTKVGKQSFRVSKPKFENEFRNQEEGRAYFVWRMVRFHSGQDVTMPMVASMVVGNDPYIRELDELANIIARRFFGTDMAGALRWAGALGYNVNVPDSMPASAHSGGPVVMDKAKPPAEHPELF